MGSYSSQKKKNNNQLLDFYIIGKIQTDFLSSLQE